jgi:hypothetical protein
MFVPGARRATTGARQPAPGCRSPVESFSCHVDTIVVDMFYIPLYVLRHSDALERERRRSPASRDHAARSAAAARVRVNRSRNMRESHLARAVRR